MGCSDSTQVIQNPVKQKTLQKPLPILAQINQQWNYFLVGCLSEKQSIFCKVNLTDYSINRMSIPQNFAAHNFLSMLQFSQGKYFISGGINHNLTMITADCFIYNAKVHEVEKLKPMQQARYTHISLFHNDCVYVFGGRYYGQDKIAILSQCQKYSLSEQKWIGLPSMNQKRCTGFSFVWKQHIYVLGGYTGPFQRSTKIQQLAQNQTVWRTLNFQLNRGIQSAIAFSTRPNQITIFGGLTNSGATNSVITINLQKGSIIGKKNIKQIRSLHKSFYYSKKMHIFGGDQQLTLQCYDIQTEQSKLIKSKLNFVIDDFDNFGYSTKTIIVQSQKEQFDQQDGNQLGMYIFGNMQQPFILSANISTFQIQKYYVPLSIKLLAQQGGISISQKQFILFGGSEDDTNSIVSSQTYYYNHKQRTVKKLANMNQNRYGFAFQLNRQSKIMYVFGGATTNQNKKVYLDVCQKYHIETNKWDIIAKLPQKLIYPMSLTYKGQIYIFSGNNSQQILNNDVFKYDIVKNKWTRLKTKLNLNSKVCSVFPISEKNYYLFTKNQKSDSQVWILQFKSQDEFILKEAGNLIQKISKPHMIKLKNQDIYVIIGGKSVLTFYQSDPDSLMLKNIQNNNLQKIREVFYLYARQLNQQSLQNYLIIAQ